MSSLRFRALIHFELIFVYSVKEWSDFFLSFFLSFFFHITVQVSLHHLLKRLFFQHCVALSPFMMDWWWGMVYFWALYFCSIDLYFCLVPEDAAFDDCSSVVWSEDRPDSSCPILLVQDCYGFWVLCVSVQTVRDIFFILVLWKKTISNLIGIVLNLWIALNSMFHFDNFDSSNPSMWYVYLCIIISFVHQHLTLFRIWVFGLLRY